jgi:hypothetical protein
MSKKGCAKKASFLIAGSTEKYPKDWQKRRPKRKQHFRQWE